MKAHDILTLKEVAAMLRVSPQSVRRWCKAGEMPYFRLFGRMRFRRSEIEEWIKTLDGAGRRGGGA